MPLSLSSTPPLMLDSNPPDYAEPKSHWHPRFHFSNDIVDIQVDDTRFRVHGHFLFTHSPVFRRILQQPKNHSSTSDNNSSDGTCSARAFRLKCVTVLEFEALLTFFYESWKEGFSMPISNWVALLSIAHQFQFTDAESRARREVFHHSPLDPVKQIFLAEQLSVPISFVMPALEDLVRRRKPLQKEELTNLSREMIARLCKAREKYVRESSRMFASESWLKQVASNIVKSRVAYRKCIDNIGMTPGGTFVWMP